MNIRMTRKLWRTLRVFYRNNGYVPREWQRFTTRVVELDFQNPDKLEQPVWIRAGISSYVVTLCNRTEHLITNPFFIDKCAMVGCNYAAMHLHEGKTYCYGCLRTFTAFQRKLRMMRTPVSWLPSLEDGFKDSE